MKLVIVESPAKAKTISKYLGEDYIVKASMGHLVDLPKNKLAVDINKNFATDYIVLKDKKKIVKELKMHVKNSQFVYLATDPDREGEAISWHLKNLLSLNENQYKRIIFNEITSKGIKNGIQNPTDINQFLVDAQQTRRILDRIVGYKLSPFLWKKIKRGLSAGRVQSATIKIIVDRDHEINNFIPVQYFNITANFQINNINIKSLLIKKNNKKIIIVDEKEAIEIINTCKKNDFKISKIKTNLINKYPPNPYITSTLQQDALRILNFSPKKTMLIAQQLYEGINIKNHGVTGLITYMRTDSIRISDDFLQESLIFIQKTFGKNYCANNKIKRTKKDKIIKIQNAHEAIRPSDINLLPDNLKKTLTIEQYKLYKLIWQKYIASQMSNSVYDNLTLTISNEKYLFKYNTSVLKFDGFLKIYNDNIIENNFENITNNIFKFNIDDILLSDNIEYTIHWTQAPSYFNEASLIKKLEELGIGRPSTYAPILSTILDRNYVEKKEKKIIPTKLGIEVFNIMENYFNNIINLKFTAEFEKKLDEIEHGKLKYLDLLNEFYSEFEKTLNEAELKMSNQRINVNIQSDELCPNCNVNFILKNSKFGDFLACPNYPECKTTKSLVIYVNELCPKCKSKLIYKKSKKGFKYIACENKECVFITWDKTSKNHCKCCNNILFKHFDKEEKKVLELCYNDQCMNEFKGD